ncbi:hypothetical protein FRC05_003090 [Tulasnella sp. 425]|nr:hypothetical protein FRC05_003090 [Tulasnella sp. 425]
MAPILALPQETILEIAKALDIKEALALISTCKALHAIAQARPFWVDQLLRLYLRAMATTPYRFEQTVMQGKLREIPSVRLKRDPFTEFLNAVIVPGGRWIVTANMNLVRDGPGLSFVRLWRLVPESSPQDAFPCIASKQMPTGYRPMEMYVTAGEGPLDLLVLVNSFKPGFWEQGCYIQVLNINLAAEEPEFVVLAEMKPGISCGVRFQGDSVVGDLQPEGEQREFLIWDWKTGEQNPTESRRSRKCK